MRQPIFLKFFCRKLYENERIWTLIGVGVRPLNPPMSLKLKHSPVFRLLLVMFNTPVEVLYYLCVSVVSDLIYRANCTFRVS